MIVIPLTNPTAKDIARFNKHANRGDGCWLWAGDFFHPSGYGRVLFSGKRVRAHRVSWLLATGEDPGALLVLHKCDTPRCVRPDHLFLGTLKDNTRDMVRKGRWRNKVHPGSTNGFAKLDEARVQLIRERRAQGAQVRLLAQEFSVSAATICNITNGVSWKHIPTTRAPSERRDAA